MDQASYLGLARNSVRLIVREAVLKGYVMAKRAYVLVESRFFARFWNINYFLRLT
jgi:hypothetical protein